MSAESPSSVEVMFARLEAKLDVALAQHGAKLEEHGRRIGGLDDRIRRVEDRPLPGLDDVADHEARLRVIESRPTVSPRALWSTVGVGAAVVGVLTPYLDRLYGA